MPKGSVTNKDFAEMGIAPGSDVREQNSTDYLKEASCSPLQNRHQKKQIPLKEGLFKLPSTPSERGYLIGSRCRTCGETFFPKRVYCANCTGKDLEEIALSTKGKIHTFTISREVPPGSIMQAPYAIVQVRLPEGALVTSVLTDCDLEALDIGTDAQLVIEKVMEDEEGNDIMAFKFSLIRKEVMP